MVSGSILISIPNLAFWYTRTYCGLADVYHTFDGAFSLRLQV